MTGIEDGTPDYRSKPASRKKIERLVGVLAGACLLTGVVSVISSTDPRRAKAPGDVLRVVGREIHFSEEIAGRKCARTGRGW